MRSQDSRPNQGDNFGDIELQLPKDKVTAYVSAVDEVWPPTPEEADTGRILVSKELVQQVGVLDDGISEISKSSGRTR